MENKEFTDSDLENLSKALETLKLLIERQKQPGSKNSQQEAKEKKEEGSSSKSEKNKIESGTSSALPINIGTSVNNQGKDKTDGTDADEPRIRRGEIIITFYN